MEVAVVTQIDKLSKLDAGLCEIEELDRDPKRTDQNENTKRGQLREAVLSDATRFRNSRFHFGHVLYDYKQIFKKEGNWVAAAILIGEAIEFDERTIYRLVAGYERARGLSSPVIDALEDQRVDPAAARNAELVGDLVKVAQPESAEEANKLVAEQIRKLAARKKAKRATARKQGEESVEEVVSKIADQLEVLCSSIPQERRGSHVRFLLEQVLGRLGLTLDDLNLYSPGSSDSKSVMKTAA